MSRFLIAPDKFKGSLTALEAAEAIAAGLRQSDPDVDCDLCPIADGGEGFMETLRIPLHGSWVTCPAVDALDRPISSRYVLAETVHGPTAILEMAETAGLWRLADTECDPLVTTTRGVGLQIRHAVSQHQVTRIILGLGGSATNDGGCGMAAALGIRFLTSEREAICPNPATLLQVQEVDTGSCMVLPEIMAACDVENPLLGRLGATQIFSRQKGAKLEDFPALEAALAHLVALSAGGESAEKPGAGAAGGLGFGLLHFTAAKLVSGFDLLADLLDLKARLLGADHVITGEGSLDSQSLSGKGPVALARMAQQQGIPVSAFCGQADTAVRKSGIFQQVHALSDTGMPLEILISQASSKLTELAARAIFYETALIHHRSRSHEGRFQRPHQLLDVPP